MPHRAGLTRVDHVKGPAKQHRSQESRKAVVEAAIDLGSNQGYDRTRTREIAQAAYMSEGGMFRHFHSKADLFADAFEVAAEDLVEQFAGPMTDCVRTRDAGQFESLIRSLFTDRRMRLVIDVLSASQFDEELAERMKPMIERVDALLVDAVATAGAVLPAQSGEFLAEVQCVFEQLVGRLILGQAMGRPIDTDPVIGDLAAQLLKFAR